MNYNSLPLIHCGNCHVDTELDDKVCNWTTRGNRMTKGGNETTNGVDCPMLCDKLVVCLHGESCLPDSDS